MRDWDLTTEGDPEHIESTLRSAGFDVQGSRGDTQTYDTRWRIIVDGGNHDIDLMVGFAIRQPGGSVQIPTVASGKWNGLPLGSLEVWLVAYRLMARPDKPDLLAAHPRDHGADPGIVRQLLEQLLPDELHEELSGLLHP